MNRALLAASLAALGLWGCQAAPPGGSAGESQPAASGQAAAPRESAESSAPATVPTPRPTPTPIQVPEGTELVAALERGVSSGKSLAGDVVSASLAEPVEIDGAVVVPAGAQLRGRVTAVQGSGRVKGRARLAFAFDTLVLKSGELPLETRAIDVTAGDSHKRDAVIVGGSTGAGAVVGAIAGGGRGAKRGALVGLAAGAGALLATKGEEVEFEAGTRLKVELREALVLPAPPQ